jgi:hypothetical protein
MKNFFNLSTKGLKRYQVLAESDQYFPDNQKAEDRQQIEIQRTDGIYL